jgi:hypothetical protein
VESPQKIITSESSPSGSRLLSFMSRKRTANQSPTSEGLKLAILEASGDPANTISPPPRRRLSFIDPQHIWSQPYSPARVNSP